MARIAEELLLLLLDNPSAQPGLDRALVQRLLSAAVLLDLAYDGRVRPALPHEQAPPGSLIALVGSPPLDPVVRPALALLQRAPISPSAAIAKLRKHTEDDVVNQLRRTGHIRQVQLPTRRFRRPTYAWPVTDTARVQRARSAVLGALFDNNTPEPVTATVISLLHTVDGLSALVSLNERGRQWVFERAEAITEGGWADDTNMAEANLAVSTAAIRVALA